MAAYFLDTNHLQAAILRISKLRERIIQSTRKGNRFATSWPVLCELEAGICKNKRAESFRRALQILLKKVSIWPIDWDICYLYGDLFHVMRKKGRALSHVDLVLAAFARRVGATILTADKDFEAVPNIRTENWLGP